MLDAFSRKVVGWELYRTLGTCLPLAALKRAIETRRPLLGLVHHSDQGIQYRSSDYRDLLNKHGTFPSVSRPRTPLDKDYVSHCTSFALFGMSLPSDNLRENFTPWAFFGASLPGGSYRYSPLSV